MTEYRKKNEFRPQLLSNRIKMLYCDNCKDALALPLCERCADAEKQELKQIKGRVDLCVILCKNRHWKADKITYITGLFNYITQNSQPKELINHPKNTRLRNVFKNKLYEFSPYFDYELIDNWRLQLRRP